MHMKYTTGMKDSDQKNIERVADSRVETMDSATIDDNLQKIDLRLNKFTLAIHRVGSRIENNRGENQSIYISRLEMILSRAKQQ